MLAGIGNAFFIFLLVVLTLGGVFAARTVYRALQRPVPETLKLRPNGVGYDSGFVPFLLKGRNVEFPKRICVDLDRNQLQSLRLRGNEVGRWRLTIDVDANRVEIATNASGVEREWLARLLARRYSIPQVWASTADT